MIAENVLAEVRRLGITLTAQGDRLGFDAPCGVLTEDLRSALVEHKHELLDLLRAEAWTPRPAEIAEWPIPRRERWGRRANELAEAGVPWPTDEQQAYAEVRAQIEAAGPAGTEASVAGTEAVVVERSPGYLVS